MPSTQAINERPQGLVLPSGQRPNPNTALIRFPTGQLGAVIVFGLSVSLLIGLTRLGWKPVWDEARYHLPLLPRFVPLPGAAVLHGYNTAIGPLFYISSGNLGAVFNYSLPALRAISIALGAGCLVLLLRSVDGRINREAAGFFLLTSPYFLTLSVLLMSDVLGLFFFESVLLGGLIILTRNLIQRVAIPLLVISLIFSVYTRQFYLFAAVGLIGAGLFIPTDRTRRRLFLLSGLAGLLAFLPIALFWGGFVPDNQSVRAVQHLAIGRVTLSNLNELLVWVCLYLSPVVIALADWRQIFARSSVVAAAAIFPIFLIAPPLTVGKDRLAGFYSSVMIFIHVPGVMRLILLASAWFCGALLLLWIARAAITQSENRVRFLGLILFCLVAALSLSAGRLTERYFLPAIPVGILLLVERPLAKVKPDGALIAIVLVAQGTIAAFYLFNKLTGHFG